MKRLILALYDSLSSHRRLLWPLIVVLLLVAAAFSSRLEFTENINAFLPQSPEYERMASVYSETGGANNIILTISPDNPDLADRYTMMDMADSLERAIIAADASARHIKALRTRVDASEILSVANFITENMALYLDKEDYAAMRARVNPDSVSVALDRAKDALYSFSAGVVSGILSRDPMMFSGKLLKGLEGFSLSERFIQQDGYMFDTDGNLLIFVESAYPVSETAGNSELIRMIDRALSDVSGDFPGYSADAFGACYISVMNARVIKRDTVLSVSVAVLLLLLLMLFAYRSLKPMALLGLSLFFGFAVSICVLAVVTPDISAIVIGIGSVLIGIAANYPLHMIDHLADGHSPRKSISDLFAPLTIGNVTTVGAFLSLLFISSAAMKGMGLYAASMLVGTMAFVLVFLPHIAHGMTLNRRDFIPEFPPVRRPWLILGAVAVLTVVFYAVSAGKEHFDGNLMSINYMPDHYRQKLDYLQQTAEGGRTSVYVVSQGNDMDDALEAYFRARPIVDSLAGDFAADVSGISGYVPCASLQMQRLQMWKGFVSECGQRLVHLVDSLAALKGFAPRAFDPLKDIVTAERRIEGIGYFAPITESLASNYISDGPSHAVMTILHVPYGNVDEIEKRLAEELPPESVAFDSGLLARKMVRVLAGDFDKVLYICSFIVMLFLVLSFRRAELAILAFLPLAVGWIWILGIMQLGDIRFNIVNVILATFIFGMGDDYTIFMLEGAIHEYTYGRKMLNRYRNTIALSALTMFVGMGALIVARHPAMKGLAHVTIIGMGVVVAMAYVLPPLLFNFLTLKRGRARRFPVTFASVYRTVAVLLYASVCFAVVALYGFVAITLLRSKKRARKKIGRMLKGIMLFASNHFFGKKVFFQSDYPEDFSRPAVVIANHQSQFDLMLAMAMSERFAIVMNDWTWRLYGPVVKYAGFIPASQLMSEDMPMVRRVLDEGRSVFIFPEGTRSSDGSIGRFRKGAFAIARKFRLDVVEVMMHGTRAALPKGETFVQAYDMHCRILRRVPYSQMFPNPEDNAPLELLNVAKRLRKGFVESYSAFAASIEDCHFHRKEVLANFQYKSPEIYVSVRKAMDESDDFSCQLSKLSLCGGSILINEDGYGALSLMAALVNRNVRITSVVDDPDRYDVASSLASVPDNLTFFCSSDRHDKSVTILGGGMSGMMTGAVLAHEGFKVTVLEKGHNPGGGLSSFVREGAVFDVGVHTIFGMGNRGALGQLCRRIGIFDSLGAIPVVSATGEMAFSRVCIDGNVYTLPSGRQAFALWLKETFPSQDTDGYLERVYAVSEEVFSAGSVSEVPDMFVSRESLEDVLESFFTDPVLKKLLSWICVYIGLSPQNTLFSEAAVITRLYVDESCHLTCGVSGLREALARVIANNGGTVLTGHEVSCVITDGDSVKEVRCSNGSIFHDSLFVSCMPLDRLIPALPSSGGRNVSRLVRKLRSRSGEFSFFTMYVKMDKGVKDICFDNLPFVVASGNWPDAVVVIPYVADGFLESLQVHMPMPYEQVRLWEDSSTGHRPQAYYDFKRSCESVLMARIEKHCPGLSGKVSGIWSATPLTVRDYLGKSKGNVYGSIPVASSGLPAMPLRTAWTNLYLCGEDIRFHGLCGVPATVLATCQAVISDKMRGRL